MTGLKKKEVCYTKIGGDLICITICKFSSFLLYMQTHVQKISGLEMWAFEYLGLLAQVLANKLTHCG